MDPVALYTIKRIIAMRCENASASALTAVSSVKDQPTIPTHIFKVETWPLLPGDKVPELKREDLLSLVFHADEQWLESIGQSDDSRPETIDAIHRQQRIFLATLNLLHKSVSPRSCRFPEAVWFACQVLNHGYDVRYLESMTSLLVSPAQRVYTALRDARRCVRKQALKRRQSTKQQNHVDELIAVLDELAEVWNKFEAVLYKCYGEKLLGIQADDILLLSKDDHAQQHQQRRSLPPELFSDSLTRLLPMTLERSLSLPKHCRLITHNMLEDLDPIVFVAIPRLTILAGMTWLSHLSGWRGGRQEAKGSHNHRNPWLNQNPEQRTAFDQLRHACEYLETSLSPHAFLQRYTQLETAFVQGWPMMSSSKEEEEAARDRHEEDALIATIYRTTCAVADALLTSPHALPFAMVLRQLFGYFIPLPIIANSKDDGDLSNIVESTVLALAI